MDEKILLVDDDANVLAAYSRRLKKTYQVDTATEAIEALRHLRERGPYAVVVSDMRMPIMSGVDFLARVHQEAPTAVRIMLTGNANLETAIDAVNEGHIFRFLTKPCSMETFEQALEAGLTQYRLLMAEKTLLEDTLNGAVEMLVDLLSFLNPHSFGKALKLRADARTVAAIMQLPNPWEIELAALLADIGDALIRSEAGDSTPLDPTVVSRPSELACQLLSHIPRLEPVANIILYHEKFFDESGLPVSDAIGEAIPAGARLIRVLKDLALLEEQGLSRAEALSQMRADTGKYDPAILDAVSAIPDPAEFVVYVPELGQNNDAENMLRPGDVLISEVRTIDDRVIFNPGQVISDTSLVRLRAFATLIGLQQPIRVCRRSATPR